MANSNNNTLTVSLVLGSDGRVDSDATVDGFVDQLARHIESRELEGSAIEAAVLGVIEECKRPTSMATLAGLAAARLNAQPENHSILVARAMEYLQNNCQGKKLAGDAGYERPNSLLVSSKGPGGGVSLRTVYEAAQAAAASGK